MVYSLNSVPPKTYQLAVYLFQTLFEINIHQFHFPWMKYRLDTLHVTKIINRNTIVNTFCTIESGTNVPLRLLIFWLSWGYDLIPDSIEPIYVVYV